jgi:CTP synthase
VVRDMPSIYQVPVLLMDQGLVPLLRTGLKLDAITMSPQLVSKGQNILTQWKALTSPNQQFYDVVEIALVGKYTEFHDSYLSVIKSLEHSAMRCRRRLVIKWVDSEHLEAPYREKDPGKFHKAWHEVCTASGVLVPGGFGTRGTEGMIAAAKWARENGTPYLGICLGMQIAVIEFARHMCGIEQATSQEFDAAGKGEHVIISMPEINQKILGGTMRLGRRATHFQKDTEWSRMRAMYGGRETIDERHRHRYEVSPAHIDNLQKQGLHFVGKDDKNERMEIIELKDHPWFVGVQFHPEYLSRVLDPSRPYLGFMAASAGCLDEITKQALGSADINSMANGVNGGSHF